MNDDKVHQIANDIDQRLLRAPNDFRDVLLDETGQNYATWYSKLLSSYAVMLEGESIVAAFAIHGRDDTSARFLVWTASLVIETRVTGIDGETTVVTKAIARSRLRSMGAAASVSIGVLSERRWEWPGTITLDLDYDGLDPITLTFPGRNQYKPDEPSEGRKLLDAVRADMH